MSLSCTCARAVALAAAVLNIWTAGAGAATAEPVTVAIALDTSGSIAKDEFEKARELCAAVLQNLPAGSEAGLFTFDDHERLLLPWGSNAEDIRRALAIVGRTGRFTALHDALYEASRKLQATPPGHKAIVLITDGKDEGSTLNLEDGLRVAQDSRIPIWVVGMGRVQDKVLKRIAKLTAGEYLPLRAATGAGIASKILSAPPALGMAAGSASSSSATTSSTTANVPMNGASSGAPSSSTSGSSTSASSSTFAAAAKRSAAGPARRWPWVLAGFGLVIAAVVGVTLFRRRSHVRCPTCGFELASPLSACTSCSAEANDRIAKHGGAKADKPRPVGIDTMRRSGSPLGLVQNAYSQSSSHANGNGSHGANGRGNGKGDQSVLSETVLARMNSTEEYLEKTVTLREQPVLVITAGPGSGRVFSLSHEMTTCLGRAKLNDIVLEDISVSSEHCRVRPEEGGFIVHDLKSTNGTYVNAKKVATQPLVAGDVIQIGETSLLFRMDHERAS